MVRRIPGRLLFLFRSSSPFFFSLRLGPTNDPTVQSLLPDRNARDYPGPSAACKKKRKNQRERERERRRRRGGARACSEGSDFSFFLFFTGKDSWNRLLRAGPHRVSAMFQLGIPLVAEQRYQTGRRDKERARERAREGRGERAGSFCEQAVASILSPPLTVHRTTVNRREFEFKTDSAEIPDPAPSLCSRERLRPRPAGESQESFSHLRLTARASIPASTLPRVSVRSPPATQS